MGLCCTLSPLFIIFTPKENCQNLTLLRIESIVNFLEFLPVDKICIHRIGIVMFSFSCNMLPDSIAKLHLKIMTTILIIQEIKIT